MNSSAITLWTGLFPIAGVWLDFIMLLCFIKVPLINANSVDPDQMLHFGASDLGWLCLPVTLLGVSQQKWLTSTTLWINSADDKLIFFVFFFQKMGFDISCKLSPKCQILFSWEKALESLWYLLYICRAILK